MEGRERLDFFFLKINVLGLGNQIKPKAFWRKTLKIKATHISKNINCSKYRGFLILLFLLTEKSTCMLYMMFMYSSCLVSTYYVLGTQF